MAWSLSHFRTPPRAERKITFIKAYLQREGQWAEIGIANVSATGLMAKCTEPPSEGEEIEIRRRSCVIHGRVAWVAGTRFGLASQHPVDVDALLAEGGLLAAPCHSTARPARLRHWQWQKPR